MDLWSSAASVSKAKLGGGGLFSSLFSFNEKED